MKPESTSHADLENRVLEKLLAGNHPILEALRRQLEGGTVRSREFTGVGFFTKLCPSPGAQRAPTPRDRFHLGGVYAEITGLCHGAGFVLFVTDGYLDFLEGFCYDEAWPTQTQGARLYYAGPRERDPAAIDA
jgi:hypothetical protein